jgi:hypothetical protein
MPKPMPTEVRPLTQEKPTPDRQWHSGGKGAHPQ